MRSNNASREPLSAAIMACVHGLILALMLYMSGCLNADMYKVLFCIQGKHMHKYEEET